MIYNTVCLSGGGVKGISFIGALEKLHEIKHININMIENWIGTSIGAMICFLFSLDYSIEEIKEFIFSFNFIKLVPDIDIENILLNHGIDTGDKMMLIIISFLEEKYNKKDITFKEHYEFTKKKLTIIGTNFTKGCEEVFNYELTPDMSVMTAIRISISIPIIFTPVLYNDNYYVDGGVTNNFPINHCNMKTTIGIYIKNNNNNILENIFSIPLGCISIVGDVISTKDCSNYNVIQINNCDNELVNFELTLERKQLIFNLGITAVENFSKISCIEKYNTIETQTEEIINIEKKDMMTQTEEINNQNH